MANSHVTLRSSTIASRPICLRRPATKWSGGRLMSAAAGSSRSISCWIISRDHGRKDRAGMPQHAPAISNIRRRISRRRGPICTTIPKSIFVADWKLPSNGIARPRGQSAFRRKGPFIPADVCSARLLLFEFRAPVGHYHKLSAAGREHRCIV